MSAVFIPYREVFMNYAGIKEYDIANGPGIRFSLFVSGCTHHCKGCFNPDTWSFHYGKPFTKKTEDYIIRQLGQDCYQGMTLLGGEPMEPENQRGLVEFVERVRERFPRGEDADGSGHTKSIWCFTGDTLDELMPGGRHRTDVTERLLDAIDILVDGPFVQDLYDISLRFHGSSNQRIIDLNATRRRAAELGVPLSEAVVLWQDEDVYSTHTM